MNSQEKLELLKSLRLLSAIPEDKLSALAEFLEPVRLPAESVVFEEGSVGDCLFFVSSGRLRVQKASVQAHGATGFKDLAILGPGDCFGEMALFDEQTRRSARAVTLEEVLLFRLERRQLQSWLKSNPLLAVGFFSELVQTLTKRLRRSSNELALLFDISQWLLEPAADGAELLRKILPLIPRHLEGSWSAGAYLYNEFNDETTLVATEGAFKDAGRDTEALSSRQDRNAWLNGYSYQVLLPGRRRSQGYLMFCHAGTLDGEQQDEAARTLTTVGRLIASAIENIRHRTEDALRARLESSRQHASGI